MVIMKCVKIAKTRIEINLPKMTSINFQHLIGALVTAVKKVGKIKEIWKQSEGNIVSNSAAVMVVKSKRRYFEETSIK